MPDINELRAELEKMKAAMLAELPDIAQEVSLAAKAVGERAIVERGFGATYSENKIPAFFLYGKELNNQGLTFLKQRGVNTDGTQGTPKKKRRKAKGDPDPGSYDKLTNWKEFRQVQGLQTDHVDGHYTGKTFAAIQPQPTYVQEGVYYAPLAATNVEAQQKLNWLRDRYGNFFAKALSEDENKLIANVGIEGIKRVLDRFKLSR
ncbi:MAG TPA: hypothetical protein VD794_07045 [Flavisolibacter sp.]|nr:hypothetical protein [Flavisolibacter sp.]